MSLAAISARLHAFREKAQADQIEINKISQESPMDRMRREIQLELEQAQQYRTSILQNVTTFAGLSIEAISAAARSMEEVFYKKGEVIIYQDDIGDSFYVLEEGLVSVTRKMNSKDANEAPKELVKLGKNAHFGEISLLTAEPRSATVTVISNEAKCLRMTKARFDELLATTNQIQQENRKLIGRDVLDTVPLFKSLTSSNKKKLLDAMVPMTYHSNSYICRQGTTGNVFFILTEGTCKVTVNTQDGHERETAKLHPGDFFGEVALIESSSRRTANVISLEAVNCLTLSRNDFHRLLKSLKVKILEHQATRGVSTQQADPNSEIKQLNSLSRKRRISGYNTHGQRDEVRIANILRRFARFTTESLWNSIYSRMYREMLLDPNKVNEYGKYALFVMRSSESRWEGVKLIAEQTARILELDPSRRTPADQSFIFGLMKQRNGFKDRLCKNWPIHQFSVLCKRMKIMRVKSFRKIIEVDSRGSSVFMILRGSVRIFSRMPGTNSRVIYEEDLFPGEIFGEAVLSGMHTRLLTALSITAVDLAVIDDQDYMTAQDRDSVQMGTEEKSKYLASVPMFRNWDNYKLLRLAHALVQDEIDKNTVLQRHNHPSKEIYFVVNGRVDILDSLSKKNTITSLLKYDYFGESGFLNKFMHKIPANTSTSGIPLPSNNNNLSKQKLAEEFYAVSVTKIEVLILNEANYHLFDMTSIEPFRDAFLAKLSWRRIRVQKMRHERAEVRKKYAVMRFEADFLPEWNSKESKLPHGDDGDESFSLPPSLMGMDLGKSRPGSPKAIVIEEETKEIELSRVDIAYQNALVHPLDDRLNDQNYWKGNQNPDDVLIQAIPSNTANGKDPQTNSEDEKVDIHSSAPIITPKEKRDIEVNASLRTVNYVHLGDNRQFLINNLDDIPVLLAKDYDMLMVSSSVHARFFGKAQKFLAHGKRPLSGKTVPYRPLSPSKLSEGNDFYQSVPIEFVAPEGENINENNNNNDSNANGFLDANVPVGIANLPSVPTSEFPAGDGIHASETHDSNYNNGIAYYYNNNVINSFDLGDAFNSNPPSYDAEHLNLHSNGPSRENSPTARERRTPNSGPTRRASTSYTPGVKPTFSIPDGADGKKEYQFKFMEDPSDPTNHFDPNNDPFVKMIDSFDEQEFNNEITIRTSNNNKLSRNSSSRRMSSASPVPTSGTLTRTASANQLMNQQAQHHHPAYQQPPVSAGYRQGDSRDNSPPALRRPATSPQLLSPSPKASDSPASIHDSQLMIIKHVNHPNLPKPNTAGNKNRKPSSAINHSTTNLTRPQAAMEQLMSRPVSKRKSSVIAIEIDPDGNEVRNDPPSRLPSPHHANQQAHPFSAANARSLFTTSPGQPFSAKNDPISSGNKLPFLAMNQQQQRPFTAPKAIFNESEPTSAGGSIVIRGQYIMVANNSGANRDNNLGSSGGNGNNSNSPKRPISSSNIFHPKRNSVNYQLGEEVAANLAYAPGSNENGAMERRSFQPPRLMNSANNKLLNQRRKF